MVAYDPGMAANRRGGILLALVDAALTVGEAHPDSADEHCALPFDNVSERLERADHVLSRRASHEHRTGFVSDIAKELAHCPGWHSAGLNRHARASRARRLSVRDTHGPHLGCPFLSAAVGLTADAPVHASHLTLGDGALEPRAEQCIDGLPDSAEAVVREPRSRPLA
jgi:hypothetical protein